MTETLTTPQEPIQVTEETPVVTPEKKKRAPRKKKEVEPEGTYFPIIEPDHLRVFEDRVAVLEQKIASLQEAIKEFSILSVFSPSSSELQPLYEIQHPGLSEETSD